jgi:hypothetical protein
MDDVELLVREALARHAAEVPADGRLLNRVQLSTRRRRLRDRTVVVAAVAGTAVIAITLSVARTADSTTALGPVVPSATVVSLAPPTVEAVFGPGNPYGAGFPFTPTVRLGTGRAPLVTLVAGNPTLDYSPSSVDVTVTVLADAPGPPSPSAQVRGHPATVGEAPRSLYWQESVGRWVQIRAPGAIGVDRLVGYANGLTDVPMALTEPFRFDLIPQNLTVDNVSPTAVTFRPPGVPADGGVAGKISVTIRPAAQARPDGRTGLDVTLGDGRTLTIRIGTGITVSPEDLIRFAAGIHPAPAAAITPG